ncbi:LexA family protein [Aerococcus vaginalis]
MHDLVHTDLSIPTNIHPAKIRNIPLIGTIACGEPITAEQNIDEYVATLDEGLPSGDLFYLNAKGDSMEPKIPDGSKVLCHAQPDVENGEIAAVLVNGDEEATLKKVHKFSNYVLLEAINEAYEPYVVDAEHPARIVGKAVSMKVDF